MDPDTICLSVDVEWAHLAVLDDLRQLLDERGLRATFFCTHPGIVVPGHERALHPNFRPDGDCLRDWREADGASPRDQSAVYRHVVQWTHRCAPEAIGVRAHSLHYDSQLLDIYRRHGILYDSSYQLPLAHGLRPFWKECGILELPIFYNDYFDLRTGATGYDPARLRLDGPGLKVLNFHPNIVYADLADLDAYAAARPAYHDPDRLRAMRGTKPGPRGLLLRLLDTLATCNLPTATLAEVSSAWRAGAPPPWP